MLLIRSPKMAVQAGVHPSFFLSASATIELVRSLLSVSCSSGPERAAAIFCRIRPIRRQRAPAPLLRSNGTHEVEIVASSGTARTDLAKRGLLG